MAEDRKDPVPYEGPRASKSKQKGAQQHAEGSQGPKTRAHLKAQLESGPSGTDEATRHAHDDKGKNRLFEQREQREQRDEAEKNSEKNRLDQDIQDHGHNRENFQVRGGAASSRAEKRNPINPENPDAPTPGLDMPPPPDRVP